MTAASSDDAKEVAQQFVRAVMAYGAVLRRHGKLTEAGSCYQESLKLDQGELDLAGFLLVKAALAQTKVSQGFYDEAEPLYRQCLETAQTPYNIHIATQVRA